MNMDFKLPELGENVASGDVVNVLVHEGDQIAANQGVVELETEKAVVEIPCPHAGKVVKLLVKKGDTVKVGQALLTLDIEAAVAKPAPAVEPTPTSPHPNPLPAARRGDRAGRAGRAAIGPRIGRRSGGSSRQRTAWAHQRRGCSSGGGASRRCIAPQSRRRPASRVKTLGVRSVASGCRASAARSPSRWPARPAPSRTSPTSMTPTSPTWKPCGRACRPGTLGDAVRLTLMPFVLKAVALSLRGHPTLNASLDPQTQEVVYKQYVNLGVAVDTPRGLVVPVVRERRSADHRPTGPSADGVDPAGPRRRIRPRRVPRRHVHRQQSRRDRRRLQHPHHQSSGSGGPAGGPSAKDAHGPRRKGRPDRSPPDAPVEPFLRSSPRRRRRGRPVPQRSDRLPPIAGKIVAVRRRDWGLGIGD